MFSVQQTYETLTSTRLTHEQKLMGLARCAENGLDVLHIPQRTRQLFESGAINDLFEGNAPYRPRYVMPDYGAFVRRGSTFLQLDPPQDFDELLNSLMILYRHVPSITNFPVYLGNLDALIEPFIANLPDQEVIRKLKLFFTYLDRTITDSFCHANLGPQASRAGELILQAEQTLQNAVPNFTLKYDPNITPDSFMRAAIQCSLKCSNPAFGNYQAELQAYGEEYGISSCYNVLPTRGGAYSLTRVTLTHLAREARSVPHFLNDLLPECLHAIGDYLNERIRFLVEQSGFFESNFLVQEGLISGDRFVGMLGVTGMAEGVNTLLQGQGLVYGRDRAADDLAEEILQVAEREVAGMNAVYSPLTGGRFVLHAQVGLDSDLGVTSGVRIPVGMEPEGFSDHLRHSGRFHRYFPAGVGDIYPIASPVEQNLDALTDVVKGAFAVGTHYMSFYAADTDLVRITGYLVKRSEMEKFNRQETVLHDTTHLGAPSYQVNHLAERKVRMA